MRTHYRRISKTALAKLRSDLTVDGNKPSEYNALSLFGAVRVGTEKPSGWIVMHVNGEDSGELPGNHISDTFGGLKGAARKAVHRAKVRRTVEDVERVESVPENEIPDGLIPLPEEGPQVEEGDAVLEVGINPHRFL